MSPLLVPRHAERPAAADGQRQPVKAKDGGGRSEVGVPEGVRGSIGVSEHHVSSFRLVQPLQHFVCENEAFEQSYFHAAGRGTTDDDSLYERW